MGASSRPPSPTYPASPGPTPLRLWQVSEQVPPPPFSPPIYTFDEDETFSDIDVSDSEDPLGVGKRKRRRTPSPEPAPRPSVKRRLTFPPGGGKPMAELGGNHDGTTTTADAGNVDTLGRNLFSRRERDNTPSPHNGGMFITPLNASAPPFPGNGLEDIRGNGPQPIVPPSVLVSEVATRLAAPNGVPPGENMYFADSLLGRRPVQERLGPLNSHPVGGFHTPQAAGYGHANFEPPIQQHTGHTFVPTSAGVLPGPPVSTPEDVRLHQLKEAVKGGREYFERLQTQIDSFNTPAPGPIRPQAQYAAPGGAPQFGPYRAPPGPPVQAPPAPQAAPFEMPPLYWGGPQVGFQQAAFGPPPAYAPPAPGPIPRTGFDHSRLQAAAPQGQRHSTYPAPFVPVQPAKPLLISEFLTISAVNALKGAPHKLLIDGSTGSISVQPDMSGVSTKKIKCPDILAWIKASERIKSALLQIGAIQGPDYDQYQESCMTLVLDTKCGGHGWALDVFLEFDNNHRIKQWATGAPMDKICPLTMANFAAMAAAKTNKSAQSFPEAGTGTRRSGAPKGGRGQLRCFTWWNTGTCARGANCQFVKGHKPCPCGSTREHAPGSCPDNPNRSGSATGDAAAADNTG